MSVVRSMSKITPISWIWQIIYCSIHRKRAGCTWRLSTRAFRWWRICFGRTSGQSRLKYSIWTRRWVVGIEYNNNNNNTAFVKAQCINLILNHLKAPVKMEKRELSNGREKQVWTGVSSVAAERGRYCVFAWGFQEMNSRALVAHDLRRPLKDILQWNSVFQWTV